MLTIKTKENEEYSIRIGLKAKGEEEYSIYYIKRSDYDSIKKEYENNQKENKKYYGEMNNIFYEIHTLNWHQYFSLTMDEMLIHKNYAYSTIKMKVV